MCVCVGGLGTHESTRLDERKEGSSGTEYGWVVVAVAFGGSRELVGRFVR